MCGHPCMSRLRTSWSPPTGGGCSTWRKRCCAASAIRRPESAHAHVYSSGGVSGPAARCRPTQVDTLYVELASRRYPILIDAGLLEHPASFAALAARDVLIVS